VDLLVLLILLTPLILWIRHAVSGETVDRFTFYGALIDLCALALWALGLACVVACLMDLLASTLDVPLLAEDEQLQEPERNTDEQQQEPALPIANATAYHDDARSQRRKKRNRPDDGDDDDWNPDEQQQEPALPIANATATIRYRI
jgi:hypothetical protein